MKRLVTSPKSGWITDKREGKRWKAKLHWRSLFRTSKRECFSQQSVGLRGDGVVISWQRGAGHVGTTRPTSKTADLGSTTVHAFPLSLSQSAASLSSYLSLSVPSISLLCSATRSLSVNVSPISLSLAFVLQSGSVLKMGKKKKKVLKLKRKVWKRTAVWKWQTFFLKRGNVLKVKKVDSPAFTQNILFH